MELCTGNEQAATSLNAAIEKGSEFLLQFECADGQLIFN
jgi:hypothetical protein